MFIHPYRYPPALKDEIEKQVHEMLSQGIIQKSSSAFSSPILLVKKKDGTYRFCVDFRHLNALTAKSKFPVPVFEQLMDELANASWFTNLDLRAGFHQILVQLGEEHKIAFQTHLGQYEFKVMVFGLTGALGSFQGAMNTTLAPGLRRFVIVLFDDILIYSHIISGEGLATDPAKVQAIQDWPTPTSVRALRGFLGLARYYRKFVRNFGILAKPLNELLKKDAVFMWTTVHDTAFQSLKSALSAAPVLALPDFSVPFEVETDASGSGIGAVLQQRGHPLAYISKALGPRNQGLSVYEKEYLAILMAVDTWRHYLLQSEFIIHTDQKSLIHLNEQRLHTPWQQKVFTQLLGLHYRIVYRRGEDNTVADALSRHPHPESLMALSAPIHNWMSTLQQWYNQDNEAFSLLAQLAVDPAGRPPFTLRQGIIMYKERIWLGSNLELRRQVLVALHNSAVGGHLGAPTTMAKVRQLFYWPAMKKAIWQFVQSCAIVPKQNLITVAIPVCCNPCQCPNNLGRSFLWTSSRAFHCLAPSI